MPPKAAQKPVAPAVSVVVPWRSTPDREPLWAFLRGLWALTYPAWEVVEADAPEGPWRKGAAVADGISRASGDLLVIADADVWTTGVAEAVEVVASGRARWASPAHMLRRLSAAATTYAIEGGRWPREKQLESGAYVLAERPYPVHPGGGMTVISRADYEVAPIDPRFAGWGQEDDSWAIALRCLLGQEWRGTADMWHLYHAAQPRQSRSVGSTASGVLHRRYLQAKGSPRTMAALIAEARPKVEA